MSNRKINGSRRQASPSDEQGTSIFPSFVEAEDRDAVLQRQQRRRAAVENHRDLMRLCFPEWEGPRIGGEDLHGLCCVNSPMVFNLTKDARGYYYMVPCRLVAIDPAGETFEAVIEYEADKPKEFLRRNGERLRLDILDIWPPFAQLMARRPKPLLRYT